MAKKEPKTGLFITVKATNETFPVAVFNCAGDATLAARLMNESLSEKDKREYWVQKLTR
jgi:hypothetical protein